MIVSAMPRNPRPTRREETAELPARGRLDKSAAVNIVVDMPAPMPVNGIETQAA